LQIATSNGQSEEVFESQLVLLSAFLDPLSEQDVCWGHDLQAAIRANVPELASKRVGSIETALVSCISDGRIEELEWVGHFLAEFGAA